jgi:hypothetical protein
MKNVRQATEKRRSCCQFTEKRGGLRRPPRSKTVREHRIGTLYAALDPIERALHEPATQRGAMRHGAHEDIGWTSPCLGAT